MRGATEAEVPAGALERLALLIRNETGNMVPRARRPFLEEIASRRARAHGFSDATQYVHGLATGQLEGEWEQLISLVTVKESYFFRAPQQFRAIERHVLPRILREKAHDDKTVRIWSAAAARGEEAATLAMILAEHRALASWDWRIVATDVDRDALAAARRGLYGERAVSQVPERLLDRWFTRRGHLFELAPAIRSRIEYRGMNLCRVPYGALAPEPFDLVLLRNVLIYFRRPTQRRVVSEVVRNLAGPGYLFLGASETLWQIFDRLAPVDLGECFAYRHPERIEAVERAPRRSTPTAASSRPAPPSLVRPVRPAPRPEDASAEPARERPVTERPVEPLDGTTVSDEVRGDDSGHPPLPPGGSAQDLLVRAADGLADNRLEEARRLAAQARDADPSEPAVYALEGFLHDLLGDAEAASADYRAALYLDPELYQVRVLLADCLVRLGSGDRAEHEFRQVLSVLDRGGSRDLVLLEGLPFPNRARARRLCRQALGRR